MTTTIHLTDIVQVKPDAKVYTMSKKEKYKLMDSLLQTPTDDSERGLIITFNLSSSGRVVNNRIYPPKGHMDGISSWTEPYAKPIIMNHDIHSDPIGRIKSVEYIDSSTEAASFINNPTLFRELKEAYDAMNPRKIYDLMNRNGLLRNSRWPGLGYLQATAAILDEAAIAKFLDGRYITFSAGAYTDSFTCCLCGTNWASGERCEHMPGVPTEDNELPVFLTGTFYGKEASVINVPANDLSKVISISTDTKDSAEDALVVSTSTKEEDILLTDMQLSVAGQVNISDATPNQPSSPEAQAMLIDMLSVLVGQFLFYYQAHWRTKGIPYYGDHLLFARLYQNIEDELDTLAEKIVGYLGSNAINMVDISKAASDKISMWTELGEDLVSQALASEDEMQAKFKQYYDSLKENNELPMGLDDYIMATANSHDTHQYLLQQRVSQMKAKTEEQTNTIEVNSSCASCSEEAVEDSKSEETSETEEVVDWEVLDLALNGIMDLLVDEGVISEDAKLSTEQRKKLPDSAFCGPGRSFPVPDCAHVTAARRLLNRSKYSESTKQKIRACVNRKAKQMGCDSEGKSEDSHKCNCKAAEVLADYKEALKTIDSLTEEIASLKEKLATLETTDDNVVESTQTEVSDSETQIEEFSVENPSVDSSDTMTDGFSAKAKTSKLSPFEEKILKQYKQILDTDGELAADYFIENKKALGYISYNFNPKELMEL